MARFLPTGSIFQKNNFAQLRFAKKSKMAEQCQDVFLWPLEAALLKVMGREREADTTMTNEGIVGDDADDSLHCYQKNKEQPACSQSGVQMKTVQTLATKNLVK